MLRNSKKEFIYELKPVPRLLKEVNWREEDRRIVNKHVRYLKELQGADYLVLAGETQGAKENTFRIVIIKAFTEEEALNIMNNDPAVKEEIMTASFYPYKTIVKGF
ncbi:uncharacterized protein YciI [Clostridium punense]|uniref:Uncharacterized protein YciI n=1 Tax=Clostridium punense TaxID=1054297 RepID=A0ABS4K552_9CLOT|nr:MULTISPECIES: YciI family protein [Clostridium]EQB88664.1 hypothetical protein M918_03625 [Clostridium sp. BL8]MBP2022276.1 uncharacterized protein YciI [Clostridium punense]